MPPVPILKVRVVLRVLRDHGFEVVRQRGKGSHRFLQHSDGRTTTVSGKESDDIPRGLFRKILRDADLIAEDFTN